MLIKKMPQLAIIYLVFIVSGCDVVKLDAEGKPMIPMSASEAASFDNMTPKDIAEKMWDKVIPAATQESVTWHQLKTETANSQSGQTKSYFVKMDGTVSHIQGDEKFREMQISVDGEPIVVQLGTSAKGNSIRDASSFIHFDLFKNQVQFARLSKELNKKAVSGIAMPNVQWQGATINALVAVTVKNKTITYVDPLALTKR